MKDSEALAFAVLLIFLAAMLINGVENDLE